MGIMMSKLRKNLTKKERESYWLQVINDWQVSGKQAKVFCQEKKIGSASFFQWRKRLKPDYPLRTTKTKFADSIAPQQPLFVPVQIKNEQSCSPVEKEIESIILHYPNGCYVDVGKGFNLQILSWINKAMGV